MSAPVVPTLLSTPFHEDPRGTFSKPFHTALWDDVSFVIRELYWTRSARTCVRGLHFQVPPLDVNKLVWVSSGSVVDVVVDLRRHAGFGQVTAVELSSSAGGAMWVPSGFAHGFQALEDDTVVNYAVDAPYSPVHDQGIFFNSIDFEWPLEIGAVSDRDLGFVRLEQFDSPFSVEP